MEHLLQVGENKFLKNIDVKQMLINEFGGIDKYKYVILCNPLYSDFFEPKVNWMERYQPGKQQKPPFNFTFGYGTIDIDGYIIQVIEGTKFDDIAVCPISIDDNTVNENQGKEGNEP